MKSLNRPPQMSYEVPPTAGLPLHWSDLLAPLNPANWSTGRLEQRLAEFVGVPSVQIECSGTAALVLILSYLKKHVLPQRDTVIIPAYTCPLVAIAVAQAGLQVVLCDSRPDSFDFDLARLKNLCSSEAPLAIIPTHFAGVAADLNPVLEIGNACGAYVLEDAAQSLGASYGQQLVGTVGDFGVFSLSLGKGLTIFQGGFWCARDPSLFRDVARFAGENVTHKAWVELQRAIELFGYALIYNPLMFHYLYGQPLRHWISKGDYAKAVGDFFPLTTEVVSVGNWRKTVGSAASCRLSAHIDQCRNRARRRIAVLSKIEGIKVLGAEPDSLSAGNWPFIPILFEDEAACLLALEKLWIAGVGVTRLFASSLDEYDYLRPLIFAKSEPAIINASSFARRSLTITNSHWLTDSQFEWICDVISTAIGTAAQSRLNTPENLLYKLAR